MAHTLSEPCMILVFRPDFPYEFPVFVNEVESTFEKLSLPANKQKKKINVQIKNIKVNGLIIFERKSIFQIQKISINKEILIYSFNLIVYAIIIDSFARIPTTKKIIYLHCEILLYE